MWTMKGENSMGGNYGFNPSWMKKDEVQQPKNYVEITPEQQAAIDKANEQAKAAKQNEALAKGLSGGAQKDLDKGLSVQKEAAKRIETGNGITRIENPDGSVEFEIDHAKYDGTPQLFAKGTKVTHINVPKEPEKSFLAKVYDGANKGVEYLNEAISRLTDGQVRKGGRGIATLLGVFALAGGGAVASSAAATTTTTAGLGKVAAGTLAASSLASCSKDDFLDEIVRVEVTNKKMADYVVNYLNDPNNSQGFVATTADNIDYKYGYDYNESNDGVKPYIELGNGTKLYINTNPLQDLTVDNVVDYIDVIGEEHITDDGIGYDYKAEGNKPNVNFDNGLVHTVGDDVTISEDGTSGKLYSMLSKVGFSQPAERSQIIMDLDANEGSYGNGAPGFAMSVVTPANLKDVTSGNPVIKGNIGELKFEGKAEKVDIGGKFILEANGQTKANSAGGVHIANENGEELYMQYEEGFDLQSVWDEPGQNVWDAVIVYAKEPGSDVFKEKYILSKFDEGKTDIALIDRSENGTTFQNYASNLSTFDTQGAVDADNYYKEKQTNLKEAHKTADANFKYMNQWYFEANAEVNIEY